MVLCDECCKPLNGNDDSIYYGSGAYCPEHMPPDAASYCGECGAHMEYYQAQDAAMSGALEIASLARRTDEIGIDDLISDMSYDGLQAVAAAMINLRDALTVGLRQVQDNLVGRQARAMLDEG